MSGLVSYLARHLRQGWALVILVSLGVGAAVIATDIHIKEQQRLTLLQTELQRSSIEILGTTLNGNLMGSITLLGLIDPDIKQEASNGLLSQDAHVDSTLSTLGNSFGAEGVFVVGQDGIVKTSWDRVNKPSTGLDVRFRPYFQMAMQGKNSVYAAVSMARGDRSLYFAAPVFSERARATTGVGAVVARTGINDIEKLLKDRFDVALLLSPQGIVFASNQKAWVGLIAGVPDANQLQAIRDLKQFGPLFEKETPKSLPFILEQAIQTIDGRRFAVAAADVEWNDPAGHWKLVGMEDLRQHLDVTSLLLKGTLASVLSLLLGWMWLHLVKGRHAQAHANAQLQVYAQTQQASADYRKRLAATATRLQRCATLEQLAAEFLTSSRDLLGATQGTVYVVSLDQPQELHLTGSSACAEPPPPLLHIGEGLLGQCAQDKTTRVIETPEDGPWTIRSGLGSAPPAALLLGPMVLQDTLIGVVELALPAAPAPQTVEKFEELLSTLANALEILRGNLLLKRAPMHDLEVAETRS